MIYKLFQRSGETWRLRGKFETFQKAKEAGEKIICKDLKHDIIKKTNEYWWTDDEKEEKRGNYKAFITK